MTGFHLYEPKFTGIRSILFPDEQIVIGKILRKQRVGYASF